MSCEEKERLLKEYQATTRNFAASVDELHRRMGTSSLHEYQQRQRTTEEARLKSELARLALEHHVATHQC
jgi:hypothetical protein